MKYKKLIIWWLVTQKEHPLLTKKDKTIEPLMPLVSALFPGINYYSITGFSQVMQKCVIPTLKKRFPELASVSEEDIAREAEVEIDIEVFLPSKGYEWQDNADWQAEFDKRLAA